MKMKNIITIIILIIFNLFLISGITAPYFSRDIEKIRWDSTRSKMAPIVSAIDAYKLNTGKIPDSLEDLIICPPSLENVWKGAYLKKSQLHDPWDNPYFYKINSNDPNRYVIISYGKDGKPSGEGYDTDIYND